MVAGLLSAAALAGAVAAATTLVDLAWKPWAAMQALVPVAVLGAVCCVLASVAIARAGLRTMRATSSAVLLAVLLTAVSAWATRGTPLPEGGDTALRVMTFNARFSEADTAVLVEQIEEIEPDVVVLLESDRDFVRRLDAAGTGTLLPHRRVAVAAGFGERVSSAVPPFARIDHVLARDLGVIDSGLVRVPGTDHRGVWAELTWRS